MPLFRKPLSPADRDGALRYYREFLKVLAFLDKESDRYNKEAVKIQAGGLRPSDVELCIAAADRMTKASEEAAKRHQALQPLAIPAVSDHFESWQGVLEWTVEWSSANRNSLRLMSLGQDRTAANASSYQAALAELQHGAEGKSSDLLKRLQLTQTDASRLVADAALSLDDWNPALHD